jgi:hypothetical protein
MSYTNGLDKPSIYILILFFIQEIIQQMHITGVGFQPDLVWVKKEMVLVISQLYDNVRGVRNG